MFRSRLVAGTVAAVLMLATVPLATAQAAMPSRSTYTGFVPICDGVGPTARADGPTWHLTEGYWYAGPEFVLVGDQWVEQGTFRMMFDESNWSDFGPSGGVSSGSFEIRGGLPGDYDGTFAYNWGKSHDGHGVGQGIGSSAGSRVKVVFPGSDPVGLPEPPEGCGFGGFYAVMSTY
jgi:hypothetical protein